MTDPQSRIAQLERGIRRWRRAALILAGALVLLVLGFGWLSTRAQVMVQRERAEHSRRLAEQARDDEARRAFLEKELLPKAK
jgi:hypothetical protein